MSIRTLCITAASVLALAAPASAFAREVAYNGTNHKVVVAKGSRAGRTTHVVYTAPFGSVPIRTPIYIYLPAVESDGTTTAPAADCSADMSYCSDPVELCQIWGQC
jgi:hypothetical protein